MRLHTAFAALAAGLLLAGCASFDGRGLVAGQSTARDVEALMGAPADRIALADGDTLWFYPRQPVGRMTYVARLAPDGVLRSVEQVLTEQTLKKIAVGTTTAKQLRELLGPPWQTSHNARMQREVWEYNMINAQQWDYFLYVQLSGDGIVREVLMMKDYAKEAGGDKD
jgi:hypothetical protein